LKSDAAKFKKRKISATIVAEVKRFCHHACIGEVIGRYHGMIARYMGDGVLAYFGYPRAQEDDAEQAVRAALALVDAVANLRTNVDIALRARIGIATGRPSRRRFGCTAKPGRCECRAAARQSAIGLKL
jgi:hypothetical protein